MNQTTQLIADAVAEMLEEDQKMRRGEIEWSEDVDRKHSEAIKKILKEMPHKWPRINEYGQQLCSQIWLLVQHADHDVSFQKACLENMIKLYEQAPQEVVAGNLAYLTDRVMLKAGTQQKYGTQWQDFDTFLVLRPLIDPENVDKLRKEVGLEDLLEYQKSMQDASEVPAFLTMKDANSAGFIPVEVVTQEILRQLGNRA